MLVTQMAKACGWTRSFALHRLYKTLEQVLDISIDDYMDLYKEEVQGDACAIDAVVSSENLYTTAIRLCNNTLSKMSVGENAQPGNGEKNSYGKRALFYVF